MSYLYDLHVHSYHSDGDHFPEEVFYKASQKGIKGLVLADHNVISGIDEAKSAAKKYDIETFEAIEISTFYQERNIHILGYSNSFNRLVLEEGLAPTLAGYKKRTQNLIDKFREEANIDVDFNEVINKKGLN